MAEHAIPSMRDMVSPILLLLTSKEPPQAAGGGGGRRQRQRRIGRQKAYLPHLTGAAAAAVATRKFGHTTTAPGTSHPYFYRVMFFAGRNQAVPKVKK